MSASELLEAIKHGRHDLVQQLLAAGADVEATDRSGETPLFHAVRQGSGKVVKILLAAGANVNARKRASMFSISSRILGMSVIDAAAADGRRDMVQQLLAAGAEVQPKYRTRSTLWYAVDAGNIEAVQVLIAAGADVTSRHDDGSRALICRASIKGDVEIVQQLLRSGADPRVLGWKLLGHVAREGHVAVVQLLLEEWGQPPPRADTLAFAASLAADRGEMAASSSARLVKKLRELYPEKLQLLGRAFPGVSPVSAVAAILKEWASDVSSMDEQRAAVCAREEAVAKERAALQRLVVHVAGIGKGVVGPLA